MTHFNPLERLLRCNRPEYTPGRTIPGVKAAHARLYRVYYGLGEFMPRGIVCMANSYPLRQNYSPMISLTISIVLNDIPNNYLIFQQVTEDSVL